MIIYFDIETLPCDDEKMQKEIFKSISPPANIKKPESIAKWIEENQQSEFKKLVSKTSFDGMYGKIACISWAVGDGEIMSTSPEHSEHEAIELFYESIRCSDATEYTMFCGHNLHGFDLPFLKHRSIINKISPPLVLINAMKARPWNEQIKDTMLMWSSDKHKPVSMDRLCKALGIEGKNGFDGSMVAETWSDDPQKVIDYCKDDVAITREIYKRISFNF